MSGPFGGPGIPHCLCNGVHYLEDYTFFFTSLKNKSPGRCSDHISFVTSKVQKLGDIVECCSEVGREVGEFGRVLLGPH